MATLSEIRHAMQEEYNSSRTAAERYAIDDEFTRRIRREMDRIDEQEFNLELYLRVRVVPKR